MDGDGSICNSDNTAGLAIYGCFTAACAAHTPLFESRWLWRVLEICSGGGTRGTVVRTGRDSLLVVGPVGQ